MVTVRERRDDEVDDTARIQEAVNEAAIGSEDIYLPEGPYYLSQPLKLNAVAHLIGTRNEG